MAAAHLIVMPQWRYRVHRWETSADAVYTQSGWFNQERRIAPISRIQTVDSHRGPFEQLFGLANVTVTTASAAGPLEIHGLDLRGGSAARARADHDHPGDRGRRHMTEPETPVRVDIGPDQMLTTTVDDPEQGWRRLSIRMLLVHPVMELLRFIPVSGASGRLQPQRPRTGSGR